MNFLERLKHLRPSYRGARERDMQEELEALAAMAEPAELGNLTRAAEEARSVWTFDWLEQVLRDLRFALRNMRRNPGFTATVVVSLALGIGANTAIFSLIDALMLRWLPVRSPQELMLVAMGSPKGALPGGESLSYAIANALDEEKGIFSSACGFTSTTFDVGSRGSVRRVQGAQYTGDCYRTFGLDPAAGRLLGPEDDREGAPLTAVISYGYWEREFGTDPQAIGRILEMNGVPVTIVGVSPPGFVGASVGSVAEITVPVAALPKLDPGMVTLLGPGNFWLRVIGRLRPGVSMRQAEARLAVAWPAMAERVISPQWSPLRRREMAASTFQLASGGTGYSSLRELFGKPLFVLLGVAGLVLLIACANVASLLLARATARQREISVRLAIGAGRGRIIRQLLTESTLLSVAGAAVGVLLAYSSAEFLVNILSRGPSVIFDLTPNWHILAFSSAIAIANGVFFGLMPALQTTALAGSEMLKQDARMTRSGSKLSSLLVSGQVALSLVLLVGAGLFSRTLQNLHDVNPGFQREGVLLVDLDGHREGYRGARLTAFYHDLLDRAKQVPGVTSASISSHTPLSGSSWTEPVAPKGEPLPEHDNSLFIAAGPDFFSTMRTPLVAGREFTAADQGMPNVAIVNEAFAAKFFAGRNPVGQFVTASISKPPLDLQIVGVSKDVWTSSLRRSPKPTVYVSYFQRQAGTGDVLVVRAAGSLSQVAAAIHKVLQAQFPNTPLEVRALTQQVEQTLVQERLMAHLADGFGVLGLVLACVGLYGLLAYSVVRRTKEIGVRVALGAQRRSVLWMVTRRAILLVSGGVAVGLPAAWLLSREVETMLFGLRPADPLVMTAAIVMLAACGLLAAYFPSQRAAKVDPMVALRHE